MGVVALVTWLSTAGGGLYLLAVWLIEYDREFQTAAKTRLPIPVISAHALLAMTGLVIWGAYLFTENRALALTSLAILGAVVALGLIMAARWLRVFRQPGPPVTARPASISTVAAAGVGILPSPRPAGARPRGARGETTGAPGGTGGARTRTRRTRRARSGTRSRWPATGTAPRRPRPCRPSGTSRSRWSSCTASSLSSP
jgi:hypothetical protein